VTSTGAISFDAALGVCGFLPRGRVVECSDRSLRAIPPSAQVIAERSKTGACRFVDAEKHALDPGYAKKLGSCRTNCLYGTAINGPIIALESPKRWCRSNAIYVLGVDSVAALA